MKLLIGFIVLTGFVTRVYSQVPQFDKLEMLYAQHHFKMVYNRANRLLNIPDYDYSSLPEYYKAISGLQLVQNDRWRALHPKVMDESVSILLTLRKSTDGTKLFSAHVYELAALKSDLTSWGEDLKRRSQKEEFEQVQRAINQIFTDIPTLDFQGEITGKEYTALVESSGKLDAYAKERIAIVEYAKKYLGTPYVWAGNDPNGFDCSGFSGYVMKNFNKELPRRAVDQYDKSRKIKQKNAMMGDLVFFDNGSGISHVGIIISEEGQPLVMIHASTSKGVIITEIEKSDYWMKRLKGFGTFVY